MRSNTWMASGITPRLGLWLGLFLLAGAACAQQAPAPAPRPLPTDPENIESMFSFSAYYWQADRGHTAIRGGQQNIDPSIHDFDFPKLKPRNFGATLTFPTGGFNRFEIHYFQVTGDGSLRPGRNLEVEGTKINAGELVASQFKLTSVRASWNYLTFPVPPLDSRLRIKTFWELEVAKIRPVLQFPEKDLINGVYPQVTPKKSLIYPGAGLGLEYVASRAFRLEAHGSGMAWPGRSRYVDAEAMAVLRFGAAEVFGGAKLFHFRTSTKSAILLKGTIWGPLGGVRFVFPK